MADLKQIKVGNTTYNIEPYTNYLPLAGGNLSGHIYLTGAKESSSTGNTSQIIFGTSSSNHVAISSNKNALVINPDSASTNNQIVLYLDQQSSIPSGISTSTVSASGVISAKTVSVTNNIGAGGNITATGFDVNSARISNGLYVGTSITHNDEADLAIGNSRNGAYVYFVEDVAGGSTPNEQGESNWTIGTNGIAYFESIYEGSAALSSKYAPKKWISANPSVTGLASASTTATGALAVGLGSKAGSNSVAIGESAVSTNSAVAIGKGASSTIGGIAMGYKSNASNYGVAIGTSTTGSYKGVAIGYGAHATINSINLGDSRSAEYSVVIGVHDSDHRPSINTGSIMIGSNFVDTYDDNEGAVNSDDMVTGVGAIAIGSGYYTDDYDYDPPAIASGDYSISIGHRSVTGVRGVGVGGSAYEYGTAVGNNSHASGSGVAYGYGASCNNKYGIAIGRDAKCYGTSSDAANANIAIGYNANITHSNYWRRVAIGTQATIGAFDNTAVIGKGTATANSQFLIGQSMKIYCAYTSIASTSDRRDKTDVKPVDDSILPFIKDLNPVTFLWNRREDYVEEVKDVENYSEEKCSNEEREQHNKYLHNQKIRETFGFDSNAVNKEKYKEETHRGKRRQIGFIAQDVLQSMKKHFGDDDNKYLLVNSNLYDLTENHDMEETVVDGVKQESLLTMEYSNFIPLIIKAMQEQQKLIEEQEKRIVELENRLNNILK